MKTNGAYHRKNGKLVSGAFTLVVGSRMLRCCLDGSFDAILISDIVSVHYNTPVK